MNPKIHFLIKEFYRDKGILHRDEIFEKEILSNISENSVVLDAGCGADAAVISKYANTIKEAVGVDLVDKFEVTPKVRTVRADLENLPFADGYFDLIISRSVLEHLKRPDEVFKELVRVLKKEGKIILVVPNKYYYASIISSILPTRAKRFFLKRVFGDESYDNFPTFYRCNTKGSITKIARNHSLTVGKYLAIRSYPYYLMFSVFLFKIGMAYDWLISKLRLDFLQSSLLFVLIKK